jgi:diaminopimelate decarboxylase
MTAVNVNLYQRATMLNSSFLYRAGALWADGVNLQSIAGAVGTPVYVYSLPRILENYRRISKAFSKLDAHIHYSAKANANLTVLKTLIDAGAGIDAVSAGEIFRAIKAGCHPSKIVFAGVGKTPHELRWALEQGVGWFNAENVRELELLNTFAAKHPGNRPQVALRLNPDVQANTHAYIATGHGGAKFGLSQSTVADILAHRNRYPNLEIVGIHVHIGSQLGDTFATRQAVIVALELIAPYPDIRTVDIGGGLPAAYDDAGDLPSEQAFADDLHDLLKGYTVIMEPGRAIVADAGALLVQVLYLKEQGGQRLVIVDGSMAELIRPALYQAVHGLLPLRETSKSAQTIAVEIVGPVCETADVLRHNVEMPELHAGDYLAVMTTGAYGMVMASNYNARPRPPEVVIEADGVTWRVARQRETWDDLIRGEG